MQEIPFVRNQAALCGCMRSSKMGQPIAQEPCKKKQFSVHDFPQEVKVEDVKTKLSCRTLPGLPQKLTFAFVTTQL